MASDVVVDTIRWPEIPDSFDPKLKQYLREMQTAIEDRFSRNGVFCVNGDIAVNGYLILMAPNRIKTFIT